MAVSFIPDTEPAEKPAIDFTPDAPPPVPQGTTLGQKLAIGAATGVRIAGGLVTAPTELLEALPGPGTAVKAGAGAVIGGASDIAAQAIERAAGVRERFSPAEAGVAAGLMAIPLGEFANIGRAARTGIRALQGVGLGAAGTQATTILETGKPAPLTDTIYGAGIGGAFGAGGELAAQALGRPSLVERIFGKKEAPVAEALTGQAGAGVPVQESRPTETEAAAGEVIADAAKERQVAESRVAEHPGDGEGRAPAEAGGGGRVEPGAEVGREVPAQTPVAPTQEQLDALRNQAVQNVRANLTEEQIRADTPETRDLYNREFERLWDERATAAQPPVAAVPPEQPTTYETTKTQPDIVPTVPAREAGYRPDTAAPKEGEYITAPDPHGVYKEVAVGWRQNHEELVKRALSKWKGSPTDIRFHMREETNGSPQPDSGGAKQTRAQGAALLYELENNAKTTPKLYRGDGFDPKTGEPYPWSESKEVAQEFAGKGGKVYELPAGQKGLRIQDYSDKPSVFDPEKEWIVRSEQPPPATAPAEPFELAKPESVEEQRARLAQEAAQGEAATKRAAVEQGAVAPIRGTAGDLGQMELGGELGPAAPELPFAEPAAPRPAAEPIDLRTVDTQVIPANGPIERLRTQAIEDLGLKHWANPQNFSAANSAKIQARMLEIAQSHPEFNALFEQHGDRIFHKGTGQPILGPREASKEGWETGMPPGPGTVDPYAKAAEPRPMMVAPETQAQLREAGFSDEEIAKLTPERARDILSVGKAPTEAPKEIPTPEAAPPVEEGPKLSKEAQAVYDQAKAQPDEHGVVNATHLAPEDRRALAERGLSFSVDRDNNIVARYPQGERVKDLREQVTGSREVGEQTVTPAMEAKMEREHRQELQSAYEEHALAGGEELGTVLKRIGLPALSSPKQAFKGELQAIREQWQGTRGDPNRMRIKYSDLFKKHAPDIDVLTTELRRAGFDVETPNDTLNLIHKWITDGKPIYGSEARGETLTGMGAARAGEIPEAKLTGMKNRIVDEERQARGWLPLMAPARQAMGKVWDRAMSRIEAGDANGENVGAKMVDGVLSGAKRDFNEEDHAVLLHERIRQQNERAMAADRVNDVNSSPEDRVEAQNAWAAAEDRLNQTELALHDAGTYAGRALQIRQLLARDDYTFQGIERRMRAAKGGEPLTPEESATAQETATQLATNFEAEQQRLTQIEEENGQKAIDLTVTGLKKRASREKGPVNLDDQREKIGEALLTRAEEGDTAADAGGLIHQLALNFVRSGVTERESLIDAVHGVVGDIFGLSREETRNAISGYGKFKQLDPEMAKGQLRQLKGEMQQIGKLEDMASGVAPKKTGIERRTPSDEERRLIRQVNEMKKKGGFEVTDPATQLRTTMQAIETRLTNQIRDLDYAITNREPIVNKKGEIQYGPEAERLRGMRDNLKAQYDEIFGRKGMSDEQKLRVAQGAAERSLADWEAQLKDAQQGKFRNNDKTRLTNDQIEAIRAKRDSVKSEVDALRAQDPAQQQMQIQKQLAIRKQQALQRNADLREQIARGDFTRWNERLR